jgi:putative DNA primase/helicase
VAVTALLTAAHRASLVNAPAILIDKPTYGAGASTLASLIGIVVLGREPPVITVAGGREAGEELRKQLDAAQLSGWPFLLIDNLPKGQALKSTELAVLLSQPARQFRVLGKTEGADRTVPNIQMIVLNGNNVTVAQDLVRRSLRCRLDPKCERPQERQFKRPRLLEEAIKDRAALLSDLYTISMSYHASGESVEGTKLNGFDAWREVCQLPVIWLGLPDPVLSARSLEAADEETLKLAELLQVWADAVGGEAWTIREIVQIDDPAKNDRRCTDDLIKLKRQLLGLLRRPDDPEDRVVAAVGYELRKFKGVVNSKLRLVATDTKGGRVAAKWRVEHIDAGQRVLTRREREGSDNTQF